MPVLTLPEGELAEALDVELVYDAPAPDWGGGWRGWWTRRAGG